MKKSFLLKPNANLLLLLLAYTVIFSLFSIKSLAQTASPTPTPDVVGEVTVSAKYANTDPIYQQIRLNLTKKELSGDSFSINNLILKKDRATFTLKSGEVYFLAPIQGKVTGGVFIGDGEFSLTPPDEAEKKHLAIFTDSPDIKEQFTNLVFYFTDTTFEEIKSSPNVTNGAGSQLNMAKSSLDEKSNLLRTRFRFNMSSRILADFYTPSREGFFTCFIDGKKNNRLVYSIDPLGLAEVYPEQVSLTSYDMEDVGIWTAFHLEKEYEKGTATSWTDRRIYDITKHNLDVVIDGTKLIVSDEITLKMRVSDIKFIPFDFFGALRVKRVLDGNGQEINFIQEKRNEDADFGVILDKPIPVGNIFKLIVEYEGTEALLKFGDGNFYLRNRSTWYPNNPISSFGDRATFDMKFRYPKKYVLVGVGDLLEEIVEKNQKIAKWSSGEIELAVGGFNYGDFKKTEIKDEATGYNLEVYTNSTLPGQIRDIQMIQDLNERYGYRNETTLQSINTTGGAKMVLAESQNSFRIFDSYFGKLPYKRIAMSQQPAPNFGQAWATLIYLPYTAFISPTHRVQLFGIRGGTDAFWREVTPHEIAHQWWGHMAGWTSYRDQWMSEGFSELSASIYVQLVEKDLNKFINYWEDQRKMIVESNPQTRGLKPYSVGPVTQGYRLNSAKTGNIARYMLYPKGAYILHMLRMMMTNNVNGDAQFRAMMQDFVKTHYNTDVSTNDFKKIVDKHLTKEMNLNQNGKSDWFFNQWVYGTEVPAYKFEYKLEGSVLSGTITQSGVSDKFVMLVPIYVDFGNGWIKLGTIPIEGNKTIDLGKIDLRQTPKKAAIAALNDILATSIENINKK